MARHIVKALQVLFRWINSIERYSSLLPNLFLVCRGWGTGRVVIPEPRLSDQQTYCVLAK